MEQVPLGLPASILPSMSAVLSPECSSQFVRVQPNNLNTVISPATTVSASATVPTQIPFPSTPIQFSIPSGSSPNVFIDYSKSTLQFRCRYQVTTASTTNYSGTVAFLQGSANSWFNRITEMVNGAVVDDRTGLDIAANSDLTWSYNVADRDANVLSLGIQGEGEGIDSRNDCQGHSIPAFTSAAGVIALGSNYYSYAVPLKSALIGADAKSMFPIGRAGKYDLTLYTPPIAPISLLNFTAGGLGAGAVVQVTIDQINIELFYLTLDQRSAALLPAVGRPWALSSTTSRVGSGVIQGGSSGALSVQVPIRAKSVRSLSSRFSDSVISTVGAVNGQFDSKCPLVSSMSYYLAGQKRVPNVPHSSQFSVANLFNHTMQAYYDGGVHRLTSKCGLAYDSFANYWTTGTAPTAAANFDQALINSSSITFPQSLAGFEFAEDLRLASTTNFMNGSDLTSSNSYLELNVLNAPTATQYVSFIAKCDIIFIVMPDGNVEVRI